MNPRWADGTGLPTRHAISAALRVAALIDPDGSPVIDARETYWHVASGGTLPPPDLAMGERLLIDLGLAVVDDGVLSRTPLLDTFVDGEIETAAASMFLACIELLPTETVLELGPDLEGRALKCVRGKEQRQEVLTAINGKFDAIRRATIGDIGEEHILAEARQELADAGHGRLARSIRRVSLVSDAYGYDITAPRLHGPDRLLEVKATNTITGGKVNIFISRHEADVGSRYDNWSLVICHVHDLDGRLAETLGWLRYADIAPRLPLDAQDGRWESASLTIPLTTTSGGLPSAFL